MFDAIFELVIGIVLILFLAGFIAGANTATLSATDVLILGFVPTIALILIIMGAVKMMRKTGGI
jgi:hypothetical protein